ncbi:1,4-alpha-glucan branching protein GlgB [Clostridium oryzae]|uniref:1,4-alpha-glucan branching enzyme GlgB n=1 Tax=Clostridium oryzae TaxID=1450648 RepID=A0A1V4IXH9_9CLOT|nr:1,4-alpha-glucan branching protein GlgB [Clostridium oryzae]OPJ64603.1 1,4-alpha-glucan branching enzyme GlgB [Clostridium oryzae]
MMKNDIFRERVNFDYNKFIKGECSSAYNFFGCHLTEENGKKGAHFAVFAPGAKEVRLVGDFNDWNGQRFIMNKDKCGIWYLFVEKIIPGNTYMYEIVGHNNKKVLKSDPYAFYSQLRPQNASQVECLDNYKWNDENWLCGRKNINIYKRPVNIYEVHAGSWKTNDGVPYGYRQLADELTAYVKDMGYTHIELLPLTEHPLDESWGYQTTGYYSLTSRYGSNEDFMYFVNKCHECGIGVILDWAPGHFCKDEHGLYNFDGNYLFESDNEKLRENYDWGTANFDFKKGHVRSFLISNAVFWFRKYHIDGIRVDAVANIMYLNYGKKNDLDIKNEFGGYENLDAIKFLKTLNEKVFESVDNPLMIAEDSSIQSMVTAPTYMGGIGFNYKWNMGWMNETLKYMEKDPVYRKWHHNSVTFTISYTYSENFILPLSHDEVVHGKKSLIDKMPGDYWQKFANLRVLYGYMMAHPGKKLLFMGSEFAQFIEWNCKQQLDWLLLEYPAHDAMRFYVKSLNHFYLKDKTFWELDHSKEGFEWIDCQNYEQSVISFIRKAEDGDFSIIVCNFTPVTRYDYKIGVPKLGDYKEVFNSDRKEFGGSGETVEGILCAEKEKWNNEQYSIKTKIPPLGFVVIKPR